MKRPTHLSVGSRTLWDHVTGTYELEAGDLLRLRTCCEAFDRLQGARRRIKADGLFVRDRFDQLKAHPAVAVERDARVGFLRALRELGLDVVDVDADEAARPPRVAALEVVK